MCTVFDLCILNGICNGDPQGRYTFISEAGCSVDDYFLLTCDFFATVFDSCMLNVAERTESDHMPVELHIKE